MGNTHLIVGLGNPGDEYTYTRHNLGFLVLRHIAEQQGLKFTKKFGGDGLIARGEVAGQDVALLLPLTYVNNSGVAVKRALTEYQADLSRLLVVCDDVDLPFGRSRLRVQGGDGGHNGLTSVIGHLKTKKFARLRLGVGSPSAKEDMVDHVLGQFSSDEKKQLQEFIAGAAECCLGWIKNGTHIAMNQFNRRTENE